MKRSIEALRARTPATAAALAGAALLSAAAFGGSAAGLIIVTAACAAWVVWTRRKGASRDAREGLSLLSSVALPGGGRIHEVSVAGRILVVGVAAGGMSLLDKRARDGGDPVDA